MRISPIAFVLTIPVRIYQLVISPIKPKTCRFHPTCSSYAIEALRVHGAVRGSWLTVRRLCRCHPFCEPGWDPVPQRGIRGRSLRERHSTAATPHPRPGTGPAPH